MARRSFMQVLGDLRRGKTQDELTNKLSELVRAVEDTGRAGTLSLTIKVKPAAKDSTLVQIDDIIVCKTPEIARAPTFMHTTPDHGLSLDDPEAKDRPEKLRSVETPTPEFREVGANG